MCVSDDEYVAETPVRVGAVRITSTTLTRFLWRRQHSDESTYMLAHINIDLQVAVETPRYQARN
jgi:hypothetical protein